MVDILSNQYSANRLPFASHAILKSLTSERMISLSELTHFNAQGRAKMVDVSDKKDSVRTARATTSVLLNKAIYQQIKEGTNKKAMFLPLLR